MSYTLILSVILWCV